MIRLKYLSKRAVLLYALLMSIGSQASPTLHTEAFVHPGLLQTREDFTRIREKLANYNQPWLAGWQKRHWVKSDKKPALNVDLWERLLPLIAAHDVRYHWVKGHAENEYNNRCDQQAVLESQKFK